MRPVAFQLRRRRFADGDEVEAAGAGEGQFHAEGERRGTRTVDLFGERVEAVPCLAGLPKYQQS